MIYIPEMKAVQSFKVHADTPGRRVHRESEAINGRS